MSDQTLAKGLAAILQRIRPRLLRSLASLALIDRRHLGCALSTADGQLVAIDNPARLGILGAVTRSVLAYFGDTLAEGDIVLTNDPFSGGSHVQDAALVKPVFAAGRQLGYATFQVPLADIGGNALGGYFPRALEIWAEGVRVTPIRLYRGGVLQRDALTMLTLNSRLPHLIEKDLELLVAALEACQNEVAALAAQYSSGAYTQALHDILADTEGLVRAELGKIAPGEWRTESGPVHSCLEDDEFRVALRLSLADGNTPSRLQRQLGCGQRICQQHAGNDDRRRPAAPGGPVAGNPGQRRAAAPRVRCHSRAQFSARHAPHVGRLVALPAEPGRGPGGARGSAPGPGRPDSCRTAGIAGCGPRLQAAAGSS